MSLKKPASRTAGTDEELGQPARLNAQFGRSASSLHAEVVSSRIRNELHSGPNSRSGSSTDLSRQLSPPFSPSGNTLAASFQPPTEPVNPFSAGSRSSVASSSSASRSSNDRNSADMAKKAGTFAADSPKTVQGLPPPRRPGMGIIQDNSPYLRAAPPMSVRDLGSDYTRYFNPFSDSRRSSWVSLGGGSTPLNARSRTDLALLPTSFYGKDKMYSSANSSSAKLTSDANAEKSFSPWVDDRLIAPYDKENGYAFPMFMDEKEDDDDMHMPMPDDDIKYKASIKDRLRGENLASSIGLLFMIIGLLFIFIAVPALSYRGIWRGLGYFETPMPEADKIEAWAQVTNATYPLLKGIRKGLIDPDTPKSAMKRKDLNGEDLVLVFSDEFNDNNRTFYPGDDPYFYAPDFWYGATMDSEWYDPDAVTTYDGTLELRMDKFRNHNLDLRSGMLHSWNQLCFKGGVFEVSISLPGPGGVMGFWPGAWAMGNLGRPGYMATTDGLWPYTYDDCDVGITPNQSQTDGTSRLPGQRLNSCTCKGEDHPTPGRGRGAPEIDILEGSANGRGLGVVTQSFQVAPFDVWYYPDYEYMEFPDYGISFPNTWTGGPYQQAVSATSNLNNDWYDGRQYQKYAFEYVPGSGDDSYIAWFIGDDVTFRMNADAVRPNGNIGQRPVAEEPLSLVLNFGISTNWAYIEWEKLLFPAVMRVDYIRWYQPKDNQMVTCDPPGYETTQYIADHPEAYSNVNLTHWNQTGYDWPKNDFMNGC